MLSLFANTASANHTKPTTRASHPRCLLWLLPLLVLCVTRMQGIWVVLRATNPANPVHNIRIMPKALENVADRQPFHPWVLKDLERYSVLRFMSWLATNVDGAGSGAPTRVWGQRVLPDQESQTGSGGVAWEYIVGLCNQLGASPWINIHHLADDAYVEAVAQYLKEKLRPDVNVFVEHSNEVGVLALALGCFLKSGFVGCLGHTH